MKKICLTLIALALAATAHAEAPAGEIRAEATGVRSDKGAVKCALFPSSAGFPRSPRITTTAAIRDGRAVCVFAARPAGAYAVAVFHDENGNGKLDTNLVGAPKEGIGFSNDARAKLAPPPFEAARFAHAGTSTRLSIHLVY